MNGEWQLILNWVFGITGLLIGFWLNSIWNAVKDLQVQDRLLADRVSEINVLVAGRYIQREEFAQVSGEIQRKLDIIMDRLALKADRQTGILRGGDPL